MTVQVGAFGYLAVLQRLSVAAARDVGGGRSGRLLIPTLTCDAPLVALHLAARGLATAGGFSNPGGLAAGRAAAALLRRALAVCVFGPDCGAPFELQILHGDGEIVWHNDPQPGLASLRRTRPPVVPYLYLDAYEWLAPTILAALDADDSPLKSAALFVNCGRIAPADGLSAVRQWRARTPGRLETQMSIAGSSLFECRAAAEAAVAAGADLALVTAGAAGLAVAKPNDGAATAALPVADFIDAAGAGAAAAAAIMAVRLQSPNAAAATLAAAAAAAGRAQCQTDGALPAASLAASSLAAWPPPSSEIDPRRRKTPLAT